MKTTFRQICVALVLAGITVTSSRMLQSDFLGSFLDTNLVVLLLALTAINGSTIGIVVGKMSDIMARDSTMKFTATRVSLKAANAEQLALVVLAFVLQILKHSVTFKSVIPHQALIIETLLTACLIQSIQIVFDMLHSVFVLVDKETK